MNSSRSSMPVRQPMPIRSSMPVRQPMPIRSSMPTQGAKRMSATPAPGGKMPISTAPPPMATYAKGGVVNADLKKMGRNKAKAKNQK